MPIMKIMSNKIRCKKCGDVIQSVSTFDISYCSCRSVAVEGGKDYLYRKGSKDKYEELSQVLEV